MAKMSLSGLGRKTRPDISIISSYGLHLGNDAIGATMAHRSAEQTERLRKAGLRPTRQRVALAAILFGRGDRHVTAEGLTGIDAAAFDALVKDAKMKCPISKALNPSIEITVATSVK